MRVFPENIGERTWQPVSEPTSSVHAGLLAFPAALLPGLPVPVCLELSDGAGNVLFVATGSEEALRLRETEHVTVLDGDEWSALVVGAESDRVFPGDLAVLLGTRGPGRITLEAALSYARPDPPRGWSVATVLSRLGLSPRAGRLGAPAANRAPASMGSARQAA